VCTPAGVYSSNLAFTRTMSPNHSSLIEQRAPVGLPAVIPPTKLQPSHEAFVQALLAMGGNLSDAYRSVYPNAGSREAVWAHASRLRARQDVQDRLRELQALAAERALVRPTELLQQLYEIAVVADPAEISRVVSEPCAACWPDEQLALAADRAAQGQGDWPDAEAPRAGCASCRGRGVQRVVITPTHELRGPARRLYQGARQKADGSIEVDRIDQAAMRVELHTLLGMRVSKSENVNLNATVPVPRNVSAADVLDAFHKSRESA